MVDRFDTVVQDGQPYWFSLEAESGWGKTRLIQEFYSCLAAQRQLDGPYWPPEVLAPGIDGAESVTRYRKLVGPERFTPIQGVLPSWFWWAIDCQEGTPSAALRDDIAQFELHAEQLERAWRKLVSRRERLADSVSRNKQDLLAGAGDEAAGAVLGAVDLTMPGLGLILGLARKGAGAAKGRLDQRESMIDGESRRQGRLDELADGLQRFARAGIPLVIAIEDLHRIDEGLVGVLCRLLGGTGPVMVLSTSYAGALNDERRPCNQMLREIPRGSFEQVVQGDSLEFAALALDDRVTLAHATSSGLDDDSARRLAEHLVNPYALQATLEQGRVQRELGRGSLEQEFVDGLGTELHEIHLRAWLELPKDIRQILMLAAIASPAGINSRLLSLVETAWLPDIVLNAAQQTFLAEGVGDLEGVLDQARTPYAWVRAIDEWLQRFTEPAQRDVALRQLDAPDGFSARDREELLEAVAERALQRAGEQDAAPQQSEAISLLICSLAMEGFIDWNDAALNAADRITSALTGQQSVQSCTDAIAIITQALTEADQSSKLTLKLRSRRAEAYAAIGQVEQATAELAGVLEIEVATLGPQDPYTLMTRATRAVWLGSAGRVGEAIAELTEVLAIRVKMLGERAINTLIARHNLAGLIGEAGRVDEAIGELTEVLAIKIEVLGASAPGTLATRHNLAHWLGEAGRVDEAIGELTEVLAIEKEVLGASAPGTLMTRQNLAGLLGEAGRVDEAIGELTEVLAIRTEVLGARAPGTLSTRHNLAYWLAESGRVDEALTEYTEVLAMEVEVLGERAPNTLATRHNLAYWLGEAGRVDEAIVAYSEVLEIRTQVLGEGAPDTLITRHNLADLLGQAGRVDEAVTAYSEVLRWRTELFGERAPQTLATRRNRARWLGESGRVDEAIAELGEILAIQMEVFGGPVPGVLVTRRNRALWLGESGRVDEAIAELTEVLATEREVLGERAPDTLTTRHHRARWLGEAGQVDEAISELAEVLAIDAEVLGERAPDALVTRRNWARWLGESGRVDEAIAELTEVLATEREVLGELAPGTLTTRHQRARWLGRAGQFDEAIIELTEVLATRGQVLGERAPGTLTTRHDLVSVLRQAGRASEASELECSDQSDGGASSGDPDDV